MYNEWYTLFTLCCASLTGVYGIVAMKIVTFSQARTSLKAVLDTVVMSLDYYNSLMATVHLLRSPANAEHLAKSIAQYRAGRVTPHALVESHDKLANG